MENFEQMVIDAWQEVIVLEPDFMDEKPKRKKNKFVRPENTIYNLGDADPVRKLKDFEDVHNFVREFLDETQEAVCISCKEDWNTERLFLEMMILMVLASDQEDHTFFDLQEMIQTPVDLLQMKYDIYSQSCEEYRTSGGTNISKDLVYLRLQFIGKNEQFMDVYPGFNGDVQAMAAARMAFYAMKHRKPQTAGKIMK